MTGPRAPSRAPSNVGQDTAASNRNAALAGAALAFARPQSKAILVGNNNNGALAAAARVGMTQSPKSGYVNNSPDQRVVPAKRTPAGARPGSSAFLGTRTTPSLRPPQRDARERSKSPSHQAAAAAALHRRSVANNDSYGQSAAVASSRAAEARSKLIPKPKPRRLSSSSTVSRDIRAQSPDTEHVQPTKSLVRMFEQKSNETTPVRSKSGRASTSPARRPTSARSIQSSKPGSGITSMFTLELEEDDSREPSRGRIGMSCRALSQSDGASSDDEAAYASAAEDLASPKKSPAAPSPRRAPPSSSDSNLLEPGRQRSMSTHRRTGVSPLRRPTSSSTAPMNLAPPRAVPERAQSPFPSRSLAAEWRYLNPRRVSPLTTGDELANAMIASSLASSRAPSPHKPPPPPVPTRRHRHHHHDSRKASPVKKGMRQTLRPTEDYSSDDDSDEGNHPYGKHRKKRLVRRHPNKHNEGDRKRWRDAVTERERKRYEGVWAANRAIYCAASPPSQPPQQPDPALTPNTTGNTATTDPLPKPLSAPSNPSDEVSSIVARDLWLRSRLPTQTLETIYDLVNTRKSHQLSKEEFVVGLWLVDQRLKGRKLPTKVGETVWASVRAVSGVKVRK